MILARGFSESISGAVRPMSRIRLMITMALVGNGKRNGDE
jgi:hypothetical protein